MVRRLLVTGLTLFIVSWAMGAAAGAIEDRVNRHIEAAVEDGVRPADFHHLFFVFSWRATLSDWTLAERGLDRLAGARQIDPLMADELRLARARMELDQGRQAAARELFRTMGGLSSWWFSGPKLLEELQDFDLAILQVDLETGLNGEGLTGSFLVSERVVGSLVVDVHGQCLLVAAGALLRERQTLEVVADQLENL